MHAINSTATCWPTTELATLLMTENQYPTFSSGSAKCKSLLVECKNYNSDDDSSHDDDDDDDDNIHH